MSAFNNIYQDKINDPLSAQASIDPTITSPNFIMTLWNADKVRLNKSFSLEKGTIVKCSGGNISSGSFSVVEL